VLTLAAGAASSDAARADGAIAERAAADRRSYHHRSAAASTATAGQCRPRAAPEPLNDERQARRRRVSGGGSDGGNGGGGSDDGDDDDDITRDAEYSFGVAQPLDDGANRRSFGCTPFNRRTRAMAGLPDGGAPPARRHRACGDGDADEPNDEPNDETNNETTPSRARVRPRALPRSCSSGGHVSASHDSPQDIELHDISAMTVTLVAAVGFSNLASSQLREVTKKYSRCHSYVASSRGAR
jgi:hypothetical protein